MTASDHLGPQFESTFNPDQRGRHAVTVWPKGQVGTEYDTPVGSLHWHPEEGTVTYLHVDEGHRRQGVATSMWNQAHDAARANGITPPKHSSSMTDDSRAWAAAL